MEEFDLSIYIIQLLDTHLYEQNKKINVIKEMIDVKNKYCTDSKENEEFLFNTLTTYINGNIDESHTKKSISEIVELLDNETNTEDDKKKIYDLFNDWTKYFTSYDIKEQYIIFQKFLSTHETRSFGLTKLIWSNPEFRKLIQYAPFYHNGEDFASKGIFQTLFSNKDHNYKTQKSLDATSELAKDKTIYPYLIKYIHRIIELNESFTSTNFAQTTKQKKCSHLDFNIFILKFLHKIYENYFAQNTDKSELFGKSELNVKDYKIDELNLSQQIYVTMMYGIHIFLDCVYKIYDISRENPAKTFVRSIAKLVCEEWIQNIFIEYSNFHINFGIEDVFNDLLHYFDFASAYNKKDNLNMNIKNNIYKIISDVLGGKVQNVHTRLLAFTIIKATAPETGFTVFENFFDNLFKYINEVSFAKLAFPFLKNKISHQHALTITLLQMTDVMSDLKQKNQHSRENVDSSVSDQSVCNYIDTKSKYIFAETVFKMISNSFEMFDNFDDNLYEKIKMNFMEQQYYFGCYTIAIETAIYTLLIYKNLYDKKIIETIYPETEEKYISFVGRIISNIQMSPGNKFQFNQINSHIEKELISICFDIIHKQIDINSDPILEIKDKILKTIIHVNDKILSPEKKLEIKEKIEQLHEDTNDYPSDFIDPMTCKPIKTPVMIPNTNEIFERTTIIMQIYSQGTNPYTREPLTLEILEKYNQEEEVVKKINEFKYEKEKWLEENKK
jgi:hypothetical protein